MGFFDRFRAQPKWKNADAAVRLAGIEEIPTDDQALLASIAREDADAHVRRAAVRKVYDPAVLKDVAARDGDDAVREEASAVLLDLAIGAFEDSSEAESLKALDHLDDQRLLASVAKTASAEAVSLAALSRLTDPKAIGSVARRSAHAPTRLEAFARVEGADELLAIALRSEHRDVAVAAVERLSDPEHLKAVAARGVQKAAVRRARGLVRNIETAAAAAAAAAEPEAPAPVARDWNVDRDRLCRAVEECAAERDWRTIESRLTTTDAQWAQIEREAPAGDDQRTARMTAARERALQAMARLKQDEIERAQRMEQTTRESAERSAACERVEAIAALLAREAGGEDVGERAIAPQQAAADVQAAREAWGRLSTPLLAPEEMERFERRFERACSSCEREADRCRTNEAKRARLVELTAQAEALAAAIGVPGEGSQAPAGTHVPWPAVRQEWIELGGVRVAGEALRSRFAAAEAAIVGHETEARAQEQQRQREALQRLQQACERVEAVARGEQLTLKDGERALRDVRSALDGVSTLARKDRAEIAERLKAVQTALFPRVAELREADEWMRWANAGVQEELCRRVEALREVADAGEAARQLRELQQQWKNAAAAPRDKGQALWERFKAAADEIHARAEAHFAQEAVERTANLERKQALCEQAEALAESTDWIKTAEEIKRLQTEWKAIGPVSRGHEKAVWERFRAACDRFFTRRREDLTRRKTEWSANLARKEALIAQAEALADTTDWTKGFEELKRLQAEWKTVGPVRKNRADEVWQRFRGACDRFFERYQQRDHIQVATNIAAREGICGDMEGFVPGPLSLVPGAETSSVAQPESVDEGPAAEAQTEAAAEQPGTRDQGLQAVEAPPDLAARVAALRTRWQQAPSLMPRETLAALNTRYADALARVVAAFPESFRGTDLDPDANRRRAEELCARVEHALPAEPEPSADGETPASVLAARLREALAANTIGGGVAVAEAEARSKAATATVKDAQAIWPTLGPMPEHLQARFDAACRRVLERLKK